MDKQFMNPRPLPQLWYDGEIGDPFMMRFDGRYYLYCSTPGREKGIKCWTSDDMIDFEYRGFVADDPRVAGAYAPEVAYIAGKFYMVTSPRGSGHYLLKADSPLGPFRVISDNLGVGIDGSIFVDDDGKSYFYRASAQGIRVHDMPTPDEIDVHSRVIEASYLHHWTEGPMVIKRDGRYFLTNTGNHVLSRGYHVDYFVSHQGPDRGYYALEEQQLLLETRDEYHALGHSSSCLGPDMDTYYIIYHKNILDEYNRPKHRSMCMDRLQFNGDRMYTAACWWPQTPPRQPVCACRNGAGMMDLPGGGRALPLPAGGTYTSEVCGVITGGKGVVHFSQNDAGCLSLCIGKDGRWQATYPDEGVEKLLSGRLVSAIDPEAHLSVKCAMREGQCRLYVNGLTIAEIRTSLGGGVISAQGMDISFAAFSDVAQGSGQSVDEKTIPGAFDAVHAQETVKTREGEKGCLAADCETGQTLTFPVNVEKAGQYHLAVTMKASEEALRLTVNGQEVSAPASGVCDRQGMERRYLGRITLSSGSSQLRICVGCRAVIDRIYLVGTEDFVPMTVVEDCRDVSQGALFVIGHKQKESMLTKFSGYTCAENDGEGYFGGVWHDYQVRAKIFMDPCSVDAGACVFLRSNKESWYPHQVRAGRHAYCVRITPGRIELVKQAYDEKPLAWAVLDMALPGTLELICRVQGNTVSVFRRCGNAEILLLTCTDPLTLPWGRVGIQATGDGIGFTSISVEAIG